MSCGCNTPNGNSVAGDGFDQAPTGTYTDSIPGFVDPNSGCGCPPSTTTETCPTEVYDTGDFELVGRNITTGKCQRIQLVFLQDDTI